ncbi:MAG: aminotransferase class IV [Fusobacterium sp.]|uniref:aminotransferase class IV n=1 Tax=Fusobacterium sp. TaxID=68766 RepID=UPI0026DC6DAA|nr:aminotransferase class IV [Fusobacterium sp.]MDO4690385.1 aminotransferase class IV [Fusobacterium sp.]
MKINLDDGYSFGLGLFETIHIYKNKALFLNEHLLRLNTSIRDLDFKFPEVYEEEILNYLVENPSLKENEVIKIIISEENKIFLKRNYSYTDEQYKKGFRLNISKIKRNESSIFSYHKTLNCAENIFEKQKSILQGYDEPLFLNTKGFISEGGTSNIFFVKNNKIMTPKLACGLLKGIVRDWVIREFDVIEGEISLNDIEFFDEAFLTNSLMGIMSVSSIGALKLKSREITNEILSKYNKEIKKGLL